MTQPLLVCLSDYPPELVAGWVADLPVPVEVVLADRNRPLAEQHSLLARADVVIADAARRLVLDAVAVQALQRCRLVVVPAVGVEGSIDLAAARSRSLPVVGAPGYNADAVADWTVGAMLWALREPVDLRQSGWLAAPLGRQLGSLTVGLVGYGAIGRAVARRLTGFGCRIVRTSSAPPASPSADDPEWLPLPELFAVSDVVSLHAPLTPATAGMIHAGLLAAMPDESILVNTARGGLIREDDLVAALRSGRPARAVLDVFTVEPLQPEHPLRSLPSVLLTPHVAAGTREARVRVRAIVAGHVRAAFA